MSHFPNDEDELRALAIFLRYEKIDLKNQAKRLMNEYHKTTSSVRSFYQKSMDAFLRLFR